MGFWSTLFQVETREEARARRSAEKNPSWDEVRAHLEKEQQREESNYRHAHRTDYMDEYRKTMGL